MKKINAFFLTGLLSTLSLLADDDDFRVKDNYSCYRPLCVITPDAGPYVCNGWDAFLTVEFIYWTAREDHLAFGFKQSVQVDGSVTGNGCSAHPDWNYEPGFKIGFGVYQNHDGWDVYANYTWLRVRHTNNEISIEDLASQLIVPTPLFGTGGGLDPMNKISGSWELDFNVVDLELGRNFYISHWLTLRPHFGLKGTWQDQDYLTRSEGVFANTLSIGEANDKLDYWGIGIRAGLESSWHFSRCLSFLGEADVTGLWEKFNVHSKSTNAPIEVGLREPFTLINVENTFFTIKPVLELYLGLRWETWYCCDTLYFSGEGGWEIQWWADQNQFFSLNQESRLGDLFFQGLTLKVRFGF